MNIKVKQFIAYLLLLCITASVIPFNLFHPHDDEIAHDEKMDLLENQRCLTNTIQSDQIELSQCDHKSHLDKMHKHCKFCQFITSRHNNYFVPRYCSYSPLSFCSGPIRFESLMTLFSVSSVVYNKGPPA